VHDTDDIMARIAAERLVQHLEQSGLVVMKGPERAGLAWPSRYAQSGTHR
jgi:hypothetical protein